MSTTIKAQIAIVNLGLAQIEGLMGDDGQYYVAATQVCELFQLSKTHASRDLKALLGEDFQLTKAKTSLNPKAVNVIPLAAFEKVCFRLALKQNGTAIELMEMLIGLSLAQLFSDAFGVKFEKDERAQWLKDRQSGVVQRKTFTCYIKEYIERNDPEDKEDLYRKATDRVYRGLFNRVAAVLRDDFKCAKSENPRDRMTAEELSDLETVEKLAARYMMDDNLHPYFAVDMALDNCRIKVRHRKAETVSA